MGARMNTVQSSSGRHTIYAIISFNYSLKTSASVESLGILNNDTQRARGKDPLGNCNPTLPRIGHGAVTENDVVQVSEKFSTLGEQLAVSLDEEDSTNFVAA